MFQQANKNKIHILRHYLISLTLTLQSVRGARGYKHFGPLKKYINNPLNDEFCVA